MTNLKPILDMLIAHRKATQGKWRLSKDTEAVTVLSDRQPDASKFNPHPYTQICRQRSNDTSSNSNMHSIAASHNAIPTLRAFYRENPLRCERPQDGTIPSIKAEQWQCTPQPCGTCTSCRINAEANR